MNELVKTNFIYPEIDETTRTFGSAITGKILRPDGDWRDSIPLDELQNVRGIESSACYIEAQQAAIATVEEFSFGELNNNYSARFNAKLSDGSEYGGDPIKGAMSIKHYGLIPDHMMPFGGEIESWDDFNSWKGVNEADCKWAGKKWKRKRDANFKVIAERHYPTEVKYRNLKEYLKRGPCPISVVAWFERDGKYYKPEGMRDNHLTEAVYLDEHNQIHVRDTYAPHAKILEANTDFDFAMVWFVDKKKEQKTLLECLRSLWS